MSYRLKRPDLADAAFGCGCATILLAFAVKLAIIVAVIWLAYRVGVYVGAR